jgi:hypothetical protein
MSHRCSLQPNAHAARSPRSPVFTPASTHKPGVVISPFRGGLDGIKPYQLTGHGAWRCLALRCVAAVFSVAETRLIVAPAIIPNRAYDELFSHLVAVV